MQNKVDKESFVIVCAYIVKNKNGLITNKLGQEVGQAESMSKCNTK